MHKYSSPTHRSHLWYLPRHQGVPHSITTSVVICTIIWKGTATSQPGKPVHYSDDCWLCWCSEVQGTDGSQGSQLPAQFHPWQAQQALAGALILGEKEQRLSLGTGKAPWHTGHLNSILPGSQGHVQRSGQDWGHCHSGVGPGRRTGVSSPERTGSASSDAEMPHAFGVPVCRNRWLRQSASPNLASPGCWRLSWCHVGVEGTRADLTGKVRTVVSS